MNKFIVIILTVFAFGFFSCDEIAPDVSNPNSGGGEVIDTTVKNQMRNVFVEEFTGFRCVNCPEGSEKLAQFVDIHNGRVVAVSIHAGFFSNPYPENNFDFRTTDGDQLLQLLGPEGGYPAATINRSKFDGDNFLLDKESWAGYIDQELSASPKVKIDVKKEYSESTRKLDLDMNFYIQEDLSDELRYSIIITESHLIDAQLTPDSSPGKDLNYEHNHVLRKVFPQYDGRKIDGSTSVNEVLNVKTTIVLDSEWKPENCEVIVIAHRFGETIEVLQVIQKHITE